MSVDTIRVYAVSKLDWIKQQQMRLREQERESRREYERGRYEKAVEMLSEALDALPTDIRGSDWVSWYVVQLAATHAALGNRDMAVAALEEAREVAGATGAPRLRADIEPLARRLGL